MESNKKVECPRCLGSKQFMESKKTKGFEYKKCNICDKDGLVESDIAADIILSQNEDNVEFEDDE